MTKRRSPAAWWYWKDWLCDAELQSASSSSRGIWMNALCLMWQADERGVLVLGAADLPRRLNCTNAEAALFLEEIRRYKFGEVSFVEAADSPNHCDAFRDARVTPRDIIVTLVNRRMRDEWKSSGAHRLRQQRYRDKQTCDADVTPYIPNTPFIDENHYKRKRMERQDDTVTNGPVEAGSDGAGCRCQEAPLGDLLDQALIGSTRNAHRIPTGRPAI